MDELKEAHVYCLQDGVIGKICLMLKIRNKRRNQYTTDFLSRALIFPDMKLLVLETVIFGK